MALLGFKKRFVGKIRNGRKRQTIRSTRKYPIVPGEPLYLYTGLRTKHSMKIREVKCKSVQDIYLFINNGHIHISPMYECNFSKVLVKGNVIVNTDGLNEFAKADGFKDWEDMKAFWISEYGVKKGNRKVILKKFEGVLIKW